jgi:hypothetical protein
MSGRRLAVVSAVSKEVIPHPKRDTARRSGRRKGPCCELLYDDVMITVTREVHVS